MIPPCFARFRTRADTNYDGQLSRARAQLQTSGGAVPLAAPLALTARPDTHSAVRAQRQKTEEAWLHDESGCRCFAAAFAASFAATAAAASASTAAAAALLPRCRRRARGAKRWSPRQPMSSRSNVRDKVPLEEEEDQEEEDENETVRAPAPRPRACTARAHAWQSPAPSLCAAADRASRSLSMPWLAGGAGAPRRGRGAQGRVQPARQVWAPCPRSAVPRPLSAAADRALQTDHAAPPDARWGAGAPRIRTSGTGGLEAGAGTEPSKNGPCTTTTSTETPLQTPTQVGANSSSSLLAHHLRFRLAPVRGVPMADERPLPLCIFLRSGRLETVRVHVRACASPQHVAAFIQCRAPARSRRRRQYGCPPQQQLPA